MKFYDINTSLSIPESEVSFTTSRSSGPGGQHVNKVSTKVILQFNVIASPTLSEEQKAKISTALASRLTKEGVLTISCQSHRSQVANKKAAIDRFVELLHQSLKPKKRRKPTRIPHIVKYARLQTKKRKSDIKKMRKKVDF